MAGHEHREWRFEGPAEFQEFWSVLERESPRGVGIVVAAYFDEMLGRLLGKTNGSFHSRIQDAFERGLLTPNERDDLHSIREIRNAFAHDFRVNEFGPDETKKVEALKIWQVVSAARPNYFQWFPAAKDRFLYVAGALYARLHDRKPAVAPPLQEPKVYDHRAYPVVMGGDWTRRD